LQTKPAQSAVTLIGVAALRFTRQSPLFEIALVLMRLDHVASRIMNADQSIE
jgi:hypothetical protein